MDCNSKAALYIRVSTEEQAAEGQSVDAQIDILSKYCKLYNIELYDIYKDLGISGKEAHNRPGLMRLLQDAKQAKFNMVLVWKISRLSRSLKDLLLILDELEKSNIVFSSYSEKFDTSTAVGKMTVQLLGSIAEFERNTIIDNVKLGLQEYANKGGKTGTVLGYDNHNKQLVINEGEAEIIRLIYGLYTIQHMSMSEIAVYLNHLGCKTKRNNPFCKDSISVILSNPVYIGINRHKLGRADEYRIHGLHPCIIDEATWNKAQALRQQNKKRSPKKGYKHSFLLSGKIICPTCSAYMYSFTSTAGSKCYRYYRCKNCSCICNAEFIEDTVLNRLKELLYNDKIIADVLLQANNPNGCMMSISSEVHLREYNKTKKLLDKYVLLIERDEFASSELILGKIKELEINLKDLQARCNAAKENHGQKTAALFSTIDYKAAFDHVFLKQDKATLKKIIDAAIISITLYSNKKLKDIHFGFKM